MNSKILNNIKEEKRKNNIFLNLQKGTNKTENIKEKTKLNYELGIDYFIKTK